MRLEQSDIAFAGDKVDEILHKCRSDPASVVLHDSIS